MDRRNFFRKAVHTTSKKVVEHIDAKAKQKASHWIRPPFALDELEFLLACTRCGECESACPHDVIFGLSTRLGAQVAATPALDLLNKGCQLCDDWPCVTVCEPAALVLPITQDDEEKLLPKLATASINKKTCLPFSGPECGACAASCPVDGALVWDMTRPSIMTTCTGCGLCREACIVEPKAINIESLHKSN